MRIFITIIAICFSFGGYSQNNFPQDYLGTWKGNLKIYASGIEIPMSLQLGPVLVKDSVYKYVITYEGKTKDVREYELHIIDKQEGHYQVDEKNGIILYEKLLGNKLTSIFSVGGSTLVIALELLGDQIVFEVYSWPVAVSSQTGMQENEETYIVKSYMMSGYQKAVLRK